MVLNMSVAGPADAAVMTTSTATATTADVTGTRNAIAPIDSMTAVAAD